MDCSSENQITAWTSLQIKYCTYVLKQCNAAVKINEAKNVGEKSRSECHHIDVPLHKQATFFPPVQKNTHYMMIFDVFIILTCLASLILCVRSVVRGLQLQQVGVTAF